MSGPHNSWKEGPIAITYYVKHCRGDKGKTLKKISMKNKRKYKSITVKMPCVSESISTMGSIHVCLGYIGKWISASLSERTAG